MLICFVPPGLCLPALVLAPQLRLFNQPVPDPVAVIAAHRPTLQPVHLQRVQLTVLVLRRRPTSENSTSQLAPPSATPGSRTINQTSHRTLPTRRWARFQTHTIAGEECVTNIPP
ncbi:hypothetical protein BC827DRAFT_1234214 [Russula dissimulans]|nr:hypothetical protein BC827DRAFT_1234214 [Russula dissimulans]